MLKNTNEILGYPEIDWNHKTVSQKHCCWALPRNVKTEFDNILNGFLAYSILQKSHWSQGRGLGGTANLNFLIQSRGARNFLKFILRPHNYLQLYHVALFHIAKDFDNWAEILDDPRLF